MAGKKKKAGEAQIKVTDGGSLKKVGNEAKKTSGKFDQFGKSAHSADRAGRGVAQMSSNSTKNFSKLSQGISGGLVPAYATLAAQLFALDALFRFLKDAADFRVLKEGQENFAAATGTAYKSLARDIQGATDAQITYSDASQAAAIGIAAGLNAGQMIELSEAAKMVSIALGRDTTDSFNRLVRGVTKAEPELLDELGIILRLENASIRYAAALGKNKNELTTFEKSQAVANEVLRQAEEKFGAMNDISETSTNSIAKMAIAFDEVMNKVKTVLGPIAEFFGDFLARNIEAAALAVGVFASSMLRKLLPAVQTVDVASRRAYLQQRFTGAGGVMSETGTGTPGSAARFKRFQEGKESKDDIRVMKNALEAKQSLLLKYENFRRGEAKKTLYQLRAMEQQHIVDQSTGFRKIVAQWRLTLNEMKASYGAFFGTIRTMSRGIATAINTALGVIGWIGMAVMAAQMALEQWGHLIWGEQRDKKEFVKWGETAASRMEELHTELGKIADVAEAGTLKTISQQISQIGMAMGSADFMKKAQDYEKAVSLRDLDPETYKKVSKSFGLIYSDLSRINPELVPFYESFLKTGKVFTELGEGKDKTFLTQVIADARSGAAAVKSLEQANQKLVKAENDLIQALPKLYGQKAIDGLREKITALETLTELSEEEFKLKKEQAEIELKIWEYWSLQNTELDLRIEKLKQVALLSPIGYNKREEGDLKIMQQMLKLEKAQLKYRQIEEQLRSKEIDGKLTDASKLQLANSKELLNTETARLLILEAQNDAVMGTYAKIYEQFNTTLGKSIGKALRGEKDAFADIGKNMLNTLTDAVGQSFADMMMKWSIPDSMKPHVMMKKKIIEASNLSVVAQEEMLAKKWEEYSNIWTKEGMAGKGMTDHITGMKAILLGPDGHVDSLRQLYHQQAVNNESLHLKNLSDEKTLQDTQVDRLAELTATPTSLDAGYEDRVSARLAEIQADPTGSAKKYGLGADFETTIEQSNQLKKEVSALAPFFIDAIKEGTMDLTGGVTHWDEATGGPDWQANARFNESLNTKIDEIIRGTGVGGAAHGMDSESLDWYTKGGEKASANIAKHFLSQLNQLSVEGFEEGSITLADLRGEKGKSILNQLLSASLNSTELNEALNAPARRNKNGQISNTGVRATAQRSLQSDLSITAEISDLEKETTARKALIEGLEKTSPILAQIVTNLLETLDNSGNIKLPNTAVNVPTVETEAERIARLEEEAAAKKKEAFDNANAQSDKWKEGIGKFTTGVSFLLSASGNSEKAAKVMKAAAMIQMTIAIMDRARAAAENASDLGSFLMAFITGGREGGIFSAPGYRSFDTGGVATGPNSGYGAVLHGTEAVVPLGSGRSIPVEMKGSGGGVTNTSVTVNMAEGSSTTTSDAEEGRALGHAIQASVLATIAEQQRSGGLLDYGGG